MSEGLREELSRLGTEASNPRTAHIDEMGTMEALEAINDLDHEIAPAVRRVLPAVAAIVDAAHERMERGGRLIYMGAGTSGRLGVLDASECPPTYGVSPDLVVGRPPCAASCRPSPRSSTPPTSGWSEGGV